MSRKGILGRRDFLALSGAAALSGLVVPAGAQTARPAAVRIGIITPARTGLSTVRTSINDYVGEAARMGAILADSRLGEMAAQLGVRLEMLHANAPIAEAAARHAQRLIETGNITALIGGIGDGQAAAISQIATKAKVPFFNIGSQSDSLRQNSCGRYTFHVEASAAMYLDTMVAWGASQNRKRWFIVYENSPEGLSMHQRALKAIAKHGNGAEVVGVAKTEVEQPIYYNEFNTIERAKADVMLLAINGVDQIAYTAQQEGAGLDVLAIAFPDQISQTRDYIASARALAPDRNIPVRVGLWETTFNGNATAADFNERYLKRFSEPADPTGWASYHSIKMIYESVLATGSLQGDALVRHLENPATTFDIGKGAGTSFRPWDHQMRQPLNLVRIDQEIEWVRIDFMTWVDLGKAETEIPKAGLTGAAATAALDRFGDAQADSTCRFV